MNRHGRAGSGVRCGPLKIPPFVHLRNGGGTLYFDGLKADGAVEMTGIKGLDVIDTRDPAHASRRPDQVRSKKQLQPAILELEPRGVECTSFVGDKNDAFEMVYLDEKLQLIDDALTLQMGLRMIRQARWPTGECDPVIPRQLQPILKEIIELFANATVGAINGRRMNSLPLIRQTAAIG